MARNAEVLQTLVQAFNEGREIEVERFFTPDFELDAPADDARRSGHEGARQMGEALAKIGPRVRLVILHMIEQGDEVAVRYRIETDGADKPTLSSLAIYRFVDGRIAEDWGLTSTKPWRR